MVRMGIVGVGAMGRGHLGNCEKLEKEGKLQVVALADTDPAAFGGGYTKSDYLPGMEKDSYRFSKYALYASAEEMLDKEKLDFVLIAAPTYEHEKLACQVMERGVHCLSEKPMALNLEQCDRMIACSEKNGVHLMIGQCLRFAGIYRVVKNYMESGELGEAWGGFYERGGSKPGRDWFFRRELGGGGLFDQHIHDVDMVQYLYGMPRAVSTRGRICIPGSGYDMCVTNYIYDAPYAVSSMNDWIKAERGFGRSLRAEFEKGTVLCDDVKGLRVISREDGKNITPEYDPRDSHLIEVEFFSDLVAGRVKENTICTPQSCRETIRLALAEAESADRGGELVSL